ncbi:MAG: hypothetical protein HY903_22745 [Deltaproteobacteria bacterium]|nr:hypothetical protein [Deltaproteobacteria bacterium]
MIRVAVLVFAVLFARVTLAADLPKAPPPKPRVNKVKKESDKIAYVVTTRPPVPDAGTTFEVEANLYEILATPDPVDGTRRPISDADVRAYLVGAGEGAKGKKPTHGWLQGHRAQPLADAGTYGFTFTPPKPGVYALYLRGKTENAGSIDFVTPLAIGVWPIPEDSPTPPLPAPEPKVTLGNLPHGKALCEARCKKDIPGALPKGGAPEFLRSDFAAALDDDGLLKATLDDGPALSAMERIDVLAYLRTLHWGVTELFPEARAFVAKEFTVNDHGKERIAETLKVNLDDADLTGVVFVAYKLDGHHPVAKFIKYDDRVARDQLSRKNKLGYVVFLSIPKDNRAVELAVALGKEPVYPIVALHARDAKSRTDYDLNRALKTFVGQGHFNDPKSLKKGAAALQAKMIPIYFRAAELTTMYYADEREFTAFDDEFGGVDDVSVEGTKVKLKNK